MSRKAVILGGGQCKWGVREAHFVDLFQEAAKACFDDIPGLKPKDVDGLIVATSYAGRCSFQVNTAPVIAERLGMKPTSICTRCDTLCAGGSTGMILAKSLVEAGNADIVCIAGGESSTCHRNGRSSTANSHRSITIGMGRTGWAFLHPSLP